MNTTLFKNAQYGHTLGQLGVVKLPFLTEEELLQLRQFYTAMHGDEAPPTLYEQIHMTIWHHDADYKMKIKKGLEAIFNGACERIFQNYRMVSPQFIVKMGGSGDFKVHQDWSIVDEQKYVSFNMWIPLQDVDAQNGAMWIVHGSHHINRKVRGAGYLYPDYVPLYEQLKPLATTYPMNAGEVLLFYHCTIHGSPPNLGTASRVVAQISVLPVEAPFHIYFQKAQGAALEVHQPPDDFSFHYTRLREDSEEQGPTDYPIHYLPSLTVNPITIEEVLQALQRAR